MWPCLSKKYYKLSPYIDGTRITSRLIKAILDKAKLSMDAPRVEVEELLTAGRLRCACGDPDLPESMFWVDLVRSRCTYLMIVLKRS